MQSTNTPPAIKNGNPRTQSAARARNDGFLRQLAENAGYMIYSYTLRPDPKFTFVNRAAARITGYIPEEYYADPDLFFELLHVEDRDRFEHLLRTKKSPDGLVTVRWVRKDGRVIWVEQSIAIVCDESGEVTSVNGIVHDISERMKTEEALRESEAKFRSVVTHSHDGILIVDDMFSVLYVNNKVCEISGYSKEEVVGKDFRRFLAEESVEIVSKRYRMRQQGKQVPECYEAILVRKDGRRRVVELRVSTITDSSGRIRTIAHLADVTERKRYETKLKESEEKYRILVRNIPGIVFKGYRDWSVEFYDNKIGSLTGFEMDMFNSRRKRWLEMIVDEDVKIVKQAFVEALKTDGSYIREYRIRKRSGDIIWIQERGNIVCDENNEINYVSGVFFDITERKKVREALYGVKENLQAVLDASQEIIFMKDTRGRYQIVNAAFGRLFGVSVESIIGKSDRDLFPKQEAERISTIDSRVISSGESIQTEDVLTINDEVRTYRTTKVPLRDERGEITGLCGFAKDITEEKRAREVREELEEQLRQAQKMEAIGRLAGGIAHDFSNMLSVIMGNAQLALMEIGPAEQLRHDLDEILKAADRSRQLIRQLLAFARKQPVRPEVANLNSIIANSEKMLRRLVGEDIEIRFFPGTDLWNVRVDRSQMGQILANLTVNARDAISAMGEIVIETKNIVLDDGYCRVHRGVNPGQYVLLVFSDTGSGMDKEIQRRVFEPFFTTKGEGKGTGLGLPTVYGIVKQNKGFVNVYSEPGRGTTFKIYLPRYEGEVRQKSFYHETESVTGSETVLVVDDERQVLELCEKVLGRLGYRIIVAESPSEAIELCESGTDNVHLLLTDVIMPGMNGKELKERIEQKKPGIKVLFMSGYTADVIAHRGVLTKGINFIEKPFSPADLARKVRRVLDS